MKTQSSPSIVPTHIAQFQVGGVEALAPLIRSASEKLKARMDFPSLLRFILWHHFVSRRLLDNVLREGLKRVSSTGTSVQISIHTMFEGQLAGEV